MNPDPVNPSRRRMIVCTTTLLSLLAAELAVDRAAPRLDPYDMLTSEKRADILDAPAKPEIVLMGSSRAQYALIPDEFEAVLGWPTVNLAAPSTKVVEWVVQARDLFSRRRPRLVVLGINASEVRADYLPRVAARRFFDIDELLESVVMDGFSLEILGHYLHQRLDPLWTTYNRRYAIKMWGQERLAEVLPKYAQDSRELRGRIARPRSAKGYDHPWMHGRRLRSLEHQLREDGGVAKPVIAPVYSPAAPALRRLDQLLSWFGENAIPVVVAYVPNSPYTEQRWRQVEPLFITAIEAVCRGRGVPFLRSDHDDVPRTDRDYFEETHVGLPLARRLSRRAASWTKSLGLLDGGAATLAITHDAAVDLP